ncbi:restriction endonuclease subunit S [Citrobacter sp. ku-bf4]|uniref:restriction endonuclease subunit S n=1 Tax=Citrobacter TaxID=544 RepID=UPI00197DE871|nr:MULTISPECIES: restriction endonuclease subunit S [Citrobacter]MBN6042705.1 restriction endonuclease subunit S [Citrobacter sp. ku-bf4]MBS0824081.1 restriction endonuclease subunit S [Citrobacter amalonaticus]
MSGGKLPEGWVKSELDNILLTIIGGGTPSKAIPEYYQGDIPWMSVKDMNKHTLTDTIDHITNDAVENSSTNIIPAGTPIIATRMSLGKIVTASFDSAINQDLKALFLSNGVDRNFFIHWYRSQAQLIESLGTGTTVKGIRLEVLKALSINLPPFFEQKIIAEKLDTLLAQVESTKARLEQIPQILKRFRQAVLSAAVSGALTNAWRKNKEYQYDSLELGTLAKFIDYRGKTPTKTDSGIPLITAKNIRQGYISKEPREYIAEADYEKWMTRGIPSVGDVLITTEAPMGYIANINIEGKFALAQRAICLQFKDPINSFFASIYMQSSIFQQQLNENATGSTVKGIKASLLKKIKITFPPLSEQHEIVRRVEQLFAYADTIEKQVNNALARVNNLTQSILAKAFRGELTAQWRAENPDLISGENSAAALLEKIKAERAASGGKKAAHKKA